MPVTWIFEDQLLNNIETNPMAEDNLFGNNMKGEISGKTASVVSSSMKEQKFLKSLYTSVTIKHPVASVIGVRTCMILL
jgi:hypothetical protein